MRTTLDIEKPVLAALKQRAAQEGVSLGQLASQLLARQLQAPAQRKPRRLQWPVVDMGEPRVDLGDKAALNALLDQ